eukprot:scaffold2273_cov72-Skeletonema_menzelii.AAC.4
MSISLIILLLVIEIKLMKVTKKLQTQCFYFILVLTESIMLWGSSECFATEILKVLLNLCFMTPPQEEVCIYGAGMMRLIQHLLGPIKIKSPKPSVKPKLTQTQNSDKADCLIITHLFNLLKIYKI